MNETSIMNDLDEIEVSIICCTYNHEKYIKSALDSFLSQKTNFKFEILVHDDASTDGTQEILVNYAKSYPKMIKVIQQRINQYSKGVKIAKTFLYPLAKGKYFAFCEGDDFWCDDNKLQLQRDFLYCHHEYSACVHNTCYFNQRTKSDTIQYPTNDRELEIIDVCLRGGQSFHTSSVFCRVESLVDNFNLYEPSSFGDYKTAIVMRLHGKIKYLGRVMSVYRMFSDNSWSYQIRAGNMAYHFMEVNKILRGTIKYLKLPDRIKAIGWFYFYKVYILFLKIRDILFRNYRIKRET